LPVTMARIFMAYGSGQRRSKLIPYVIHSLLDGESPRLGAGERRVDWVHVDDVVEGLILASQHPAACGATVELGSGRLVSIREVVETIARLLESPIRLEFGAQPPRPNERERIAAIGATSAMIGWRPRIELTDGLRRTIDAIRAEGAVD